MRPQLSALKLSPPLEPAGEGPWALWTGSIKQVNYQACRKLFPSVFKQIFVETQIRSARVKFDVICSWERQKVMSLELGLPFKHIQVLVPKREVLEVLDKRGASSRFNSGKRGVFIQSS